MAKIRKTRKRDFSNLGLLDYLLMSTGTALAVGSAGYAISQESIAIFCVALVLAGTAFSYFIRILGKGRSWLKSDAILYSIACISAAIFSVPLQSLMPEGGFPPELFSAGWLTWMLILGSFFCWKDSTLLFQAVPSIALFGLVGVYDTFGGAVFAFFGFLVCLTTFFSRAHGRQMMKEAAQSGFFSIGLAPGTPIPSPEDTPGLITKLKEGPWRWVAGPEWALLSALVVALISLIGAPVIQMSMQGVAGFVKVSPPKSSSRTNIASMVNPYSESIGVGQGPVRLLDKPVLELTINQPRYLRSAIYEKYTGRGWKRRMASIYKPSATRDAVSAAQDAIADFNVEKFEWKIHPLEPVRTVPIPGEPIELHPGGFGNLVRPDGTIQFADLSAPEYFGTSIAAAEGGTPTNAVKKPALEFGNVLSTDLIKDRVFELTAMVTKNQPNDWAKAMAIKQEIESRVVYSINAPAVPTGEDAAEYVLFESKVAYCDLFATSMVTMARCAGIPARYVTGFHVDSSRSLGSDKYLVQERDSHAWAELLFEDYGWVVFDATEGADSIDGEGVGSKTDETPWFQKPWFKTTLDIGLALLALFGIGFFVVDLIKKKTSTNYREGLEASYAKFTAAIHRKTGYRRKLGMTASEYVDLTRPHLGETAEIAAALSMDFENVFYGNVETDRQVVSQFEKRVDDFRQALKAVKRTK